MAKRLLTYLALYGLGVASAVAALVLLPAQASRSAAQTSFAPSVAERAARDAPETRCPVIAAAEPLVACPYAGDSIAAGCPYLEALAGAGTCPYLARRGDFRCPYLAAHPEPGIGTSRGCPERGRDLAPLPVAPSPPRGVVTAELDAAERSADSPDPT